MEEAYLKILQDSWIFKSLPWSEPKIIGLWKYYSVYFQHFIFTYAYHIYTFGISSAEQIQVAIQHPDSTTLEIINVVYQDSQLLQQSLWLNGNWDNALKETFNKIEEANKLASQNKKSPNQEKLEKFNRFFGGS